MRRLLLILAGLALAACPAVAAASFPPELTTSGPLSAIDVGNDLSCQISATGDGSPDFWGNAGSNDAGACGTWLSLTSATDGTGTAADLYGPSVPTGPQVHADFTPVSQTLGGTGSSSSPYVMTTVVTIPPASGATNLGTITETDTYINGETFLSTMVTVSAPAGGSGLAGTLYHAGDCFLAGNDDGYGTYVSSSGSVQCTTTPNNNPAAREMDFTPAASPTASYFEGNAGAVWGYVSAANDASNPFPDTVDTSILTDNGMGLSWPVSIAAGGQQTYQFTTNVTPNDAPTSTTAAAAEGCSENGTVVIAVDEPNGPGQLNYVLDSAAQQSLPVTSDSQDVTVNVGSGPGVHTLEYWAQDATGEQESTKHTQMVTVEPGGPAVTITSDQNASVYEQNATATITVTAAGVGLTVNPSASHVPISTATPGTFMVSETATDGCGSSTATFSYTVLPPPVLGQSVNAGPVSGTVFIELPTTKTHLLDGPLISAVEALSKGTGFVALTQPRQIPVGSIVDAEAGVASITSATDKKGQLFKGNFGSGIFQILQNRKQKGLTRLNLMDRLNASKVCASSGKGAPKKAALLSGRAQIASVAHAAASPKKVGATVLALLKGNAHGGFSTYGRYSSATVQGTQFTVENRCDGTFTKVTRGVVVVDDFRRHKMIRLTTGKSYLAKS